MKIGIDIGGSHIAVGIVSENGRILAKQEKDIAFVNIEKEKVKQEIRDNIISLINAVLKQMQLPIFIIEEIGIGFPAIVEENKIKKCDKFAILNWNLAEELEEHYKVTVKLQNDAIYAAIAEREYGSLQGSTKAVFLCLGTGIGGATIIENKVLPSEYGHIIIERNGQKCNCGNKGCFENYCSMKSCKDKIIEILQLNTDLNAKELKEILIKEQENEKINNYINEYINTLVIGIYNIANIFNPEKICIGGSFVYFEQILYKKLLEQIEIYSYKFNKPKIVLAKLGNDAGIIGACV